MAVIEFPFGSLLTANSFGFGDNSKRSSWVNSFYLPANANVGYVLEGGSGAVASGYTNIVVSFSIGGPGGLVAIMAGGQSASGVSGIEQVYIADSSSGPIAQVVAASSVAPTFPAGSLPLAVLVLDEVGRIQTIFDQRPSYITSAPPEKRIMPRIGGYTPWSSRLDGRADWPDDSHATAAY